MPHEKHPPRAEPFPWPAEASMRLMRQVAEHSPDLVKGTLDFVWEHYPEETKTEKTQMAADLLAHQLLERGMIERCSCCGGLKGAGPGDRVPHEH